MPGQFITADKVERQHLDWGTLGWISRPANTSTRHLVVIEVVFGPGGGHNFHRHPTQEEVIYIIDGTVEMWIEKEKKMFSAGDSVFLPPGTVHAAFNDSDKPVKLIAVLGPAVGEGGYETDELGDQSPWNTLR